jgi:hypothetical protein
MSKMGSHNPFGYLKHKLWAKEGPWVKLSIWLSTIKSQESPWFPCIQVVWYISLESSQQGLQLCFWPHLNQRSTRKVMGLQSHMSLNFGNFPFGSSGTKWHLGDGPVARHKIYYKGKGGGFPQVWAVVNLLSPCLFVVRPYTKNVPTMH